MSTDAPHGRTNVTALLFGDLDRVEPPVAQPDGDAAELTEGVLHVFEKPSMLLDEIFGAEHTPLLLVARQNEDHLALSLTVTTGEREHGGDQNRHPSLHVERTSPPYLAVDQIASERRMCPLTRLSGHDIDVAIKQERRSASAAGDPSDEIWATLILRQELRLDTTRPENVGDELETSALVTRRIRRIELDQLTKQPCWIGDNTRLFV